MRSTIPALAALALALGACDDNSAGDAGDGRTAEGEVLGGTISDQMLPLDTVTSQSPPLQPEPSAGAGETASESAEETPEEPAAEAAPAPQPSAAAPAQDEGDDD